MPTNILMPALSPTMEKGNLAKWLKNEGDKVKSGDVIAEIETDKATMEVEAVDEGVLGKILITAGTNDVAVNTPIAVLLGDGENANAIQIPTNAPEIKPVSVAIEPNVQSQGQVLATGAGFTKADNRVFASPLAKRLAKELNVDLSRVQGTGPHGRIVERDVQAAKSGAGLSAPRTFAPAPQPTSSNTTTSLPTGMSDAVIKQLYEAGSFTEVPHDQMRKVIAKRLMESKLTVPHFYLTVDCELDALLAVRAQMNDAAPKKEGKPTYKLSVNDFIIKAMAVALQRVPDANVTWTEGAMLKHTRSDVGVAVAIEGGLITPVIRNAESKTLSQISSEMKDFAARARARKLQPHEYQGGTAAISNLGMFGIKEFSAIINPPHATILAVGAGEERIVARNGQPVVRNMMSVTLSTDHRAVDGALGAELLAAFKANIEQPALMLV